MRRNKHDERARNAARVRSEREAEIAERERERKLLDRQRQSHIEDRLERLRIDHAARKRLVSEITRQRSFELPQPGWNADDFLAESDKPPESVIEGLHYRGHNALLVAEYKTGKTTLEINLMASLVDGTPFLGKFPTNLPWGKVAFFNYEMDARQFRSWINDSVIENTDRIIPLNLRGHRLSFWDDEEMNRLADWLLKNEVGFIIMDPAARAWRGLVESESDNVQLSEFFGAVDELKRLGDVSNLLLSVHTTRVNGSARARGGGEIEAWPDANWYLSKAKGGKRQLKAVGRDVNVEGLLLDFKPKIRQLSVVV